MDVQAPTRGVIMSEDLEFTLIDCATGLIYGPFETFHEARDRAEAFATWEILNGDGDPVDWKQPPAAPARAEAA